MNTWGYIEQIRAKHGGCSDYRISQILQVTRGGMSLYKQGREADDSVAFRIAEELDLPPLKVIAEIHATRAEAAADSRMQKFWHDTAMKAGRVAFFAAATGVVALKPVDSQAVMVAGDGIEPPTRGFSIPCSTD